MEVTDIAKIVRKNPFLDFTDENSQNRTCKECEKKKRQSCRISKIETSGLNPNRFEPKFCLENVKKKTSEPVKKNI